MKAVKRKHAKDSRRRQKHLPRSTWADTPKNARAEIKKVAAELPDEDVVYMKEALLYVRRGRPTAFDSPEDLLKSAECYFKWCNDNPWYKKEWKNGKRSEGIVSIPVGRPFTWSGLCSYIGVSSEYFDMFLRQVSETEHKIFINVIKMIEQVVRTQKFEGAAVGAFNASIIAYDLGYKRDVAEASASSPTVVVNFSGGGANSEYEQGMQDLLEQLRTIDVEAKEVEAKQIQA